MRLLILVAGTLAVAACSNNDNHDNTTNVDENLTAENIVSNDVTAIDAVTGESANMAEAASVDDFGPPTANSAANNADAPKRASAEPKADKPEPKKPAAKPDAKPAPSAAPAGNTTD